MILMLSISSQTLTPPPYDHAATRDFSQSYLQNSSEPSSPRSSTTSERGSNENLEHDVARGPLFDCLQHEDQPENNTAWIKQLWAVMCAAVTFQTTKPNNNARQTGSSPE